MVFQAALVLQFAPSQSHNPGPMIARPNPLNQPDLEFPQQIPDSTRSSNGKGGNSFFDPFLALPVSPALPPAEDLSRSSSPTLTSSSSSVSLASVVSNYSTTSSTGDQSPRSNRRRRARGSVSGSARSFICSHCDRELCDKRSLSRHIASHSKPYCCPISECSKRFTTETALHTHNLRHSHLECSTPILASVVDGPHVKKESSSHFSFPDMRDQPGQKLHYSENANTSGNGDDSVLPALVWPSSSSAAAAPFVAHSIFPSLAPVNSTPVPFGDSGRGINGSLERIPSSASSVSSSDSSCSSPSESAEDVALVAQPVVGSLSKRYSCSHCPRQFGSSSKLSRHILTHTGERPHKCPYAHCSRSFARRDKLGEHIRTHTGEKPYGCQVDGCGLVFTFRSGLIQHNHKHHPNQIKKKIPKSIIKSSSTSTSNSTSSNIANPVVPKLEPLDESQNSGLANVPAEQLTMAPALESHYSDSSAHSDDLSLGLVPAISLSSYGHAQPVHSLPSSSASSEAISMANDEFLSSSDDDFFSESFVDSQRDRDADNAFDTFDFSMDPVQFPPESINHQFDLDTTLNLQAGHGIFSH